MKKTKKLVMSVVLALSFSLNGVIALALPATTAQEAGYTQEVKSKLSKMTKEELDKVALPIPEEAIRKTNTSLGVVQDIIIEKMPHDGKIYKLVDKFSYDGTQYVGENYVKFLYVNLNQFEDLNYTLFQWDFLNGKLEQSEEVSCPGVREDYVKELKDKRGTNNTESNPSTEKKEDSNQGNINNNDNINSNGSNKSIKRIHGENRYETAKKIAEEFKGGNGAILVSGDSFHNGLCSSVLGGKLDMPILIVGDKESNTHAISYLEKNLNKDKPIYLMCDKNALKDELKALEYKNIKTIYDKDLSKNNILINKELKAEKGTPIFLVTNGAFADSLSVSSVAAKKGYPIVFTGKDELSNDTKEYIKELCPSKIFIIGGSNVVSNSIQDSLKEFNPERIFGNSRYETSLKIAEKFNLGDENVILASGKDFPDSISGSVLAAKLNANILLTNDTLKDKLTHLKPVKNIYILGGEKAINSKVLEELK